MRLGRGGASHAEARPGSCAIVPVVASAASLLSGVLGRRPLGGEGPWYRPGWTCAFVLPTHARRTRSVLEPSVPEEKDEGVDGDVDWTALLVQDANCFWDCGPLRRLAGVAPPKVPRRPGRADLFGGPSTPLPSSWRARLVRWPTWPPTPQTNGRASVARACPLARRDWHGGRSRRCRVASRLAGAILATLQRLRASPRGQGPEPDPRSHERVSLRPWEIHRFPTLAWHATQPISWGGAAPPRLFCASVWRQWGRRRAAAYQLDRGGDPRHICRTPAATARTTSTRKNAVLPRPFGTSDADGADGKGCVRVRLELSRGVIGVIIGCGRRRSVGARAWCEARGSHVAK